MPVPTHPAADAADAVRAGVPYVDTFVHLNAAAGALADRSVTATITEHLDLEARLGNTEARLAVAERVSAVHDDLATLTAVDGDRVALSESHTRAWQDAFQAVPLAPGDEVVVFDSEWGGNLSAIWQRTRATGAVLRVLPTTAAGTADVAALRASLTPSTTVVALTWVSAVNGVVSPLEAVTEALGDHDAWLFVDAAQAFANATYDLDHPRADVVSVSGRKYLRGPRGTGFAVYGERFLQQVEPLGGDQASLPWSDADGPTPVPGARRFELLETSFAVRLGLGTAVHDALRSDREAALARTRDLADHASAELARLPDVTVHEAPGADRSGIVTLSHARLGADDVKDALAARGIAVAAPQVPYAPLWFASGRPRVVRVAPHVYNTHREIDAAVRAVSEL